MPTSHPCSGPLPVHQFTRRQLLHKVGMGMGGLALAELMNGQASAKAVGLPNLPHFPAKAKRVIFLFMSGGVSQLDAFDWKPELKKNHRNELPESLRGSKDKFLPGMAGHQNHFYLAASPYEF